jgi:hypothetical protein
MEVLKRQESYFEKQRRKSAMNTSHAAATVINAQPPLTEANTDLDKRTHLQYRLSCIFGAKDHALEQKFGLMDQDAPKTPKELVERIKSGMFTYTEEERADDETTWAFCNPYRGLRWRDPSLKEDRPGYNEAYKELKKTKLKVADSIAIKDPAVALEELYAWETSS